MGVTERRAREKEELRFRILEAATHLFATEGYESVSIRRIAEMIEYAPSTIYLYFQDKAEIIQTICLENFRLLTEALDEIASQPLPPLDTLRKCLRRYIDFGLEHPNHYIVTFCLPETGPSEFAPVEKARILSLGLGAFSRLSHGLAGCMAAGVITNANVDITAQSTWMMLHGITSLLITSQSFPFIQKEILIESYLDRVLLSLGADVKLSHPEDFPL